MIKNKLPRKIFRCQIRLNILYFTLLARYVAADRNTISFSLRKFVPFCQFPRQIAQTYAHVLYVSRVSFHFFLHVTANWASFCIKFDKVIWLLCKRLYCVKLSHLYILFGRFLFFIMFFIFSWESHQQSKISREHRTFRKIDFMSFYKPLSGGTRKMKNLSK